MHGVSGASADYCADGADPCLNFDPQSLRRTRLLYANRVAFEMGGIQLSPDNGAALPSSPSFWTGSRRVTDETMTKAERIRNLLSDGSR